MRDEKAAHLLDEYSKRLQNMVPEQGEGFTRPEVPETDSQVLLDKEGQVMRDQHGEPQVIPNVPSLPAHNVKTKDMPSEALSAAREAIRMQAVEAVNKKREFLRIPFTSRGVVAARWVNEDGDYMAKKNRRDDMAKYAAQVVLFKLNDTEGTQAERIQMFKELWTVRMRSPFIKIRAPRPLWGDIQAPARPPSSYATSEVARTKLCASLEGP